MEKDDDAGVGRDFIHDLRLDPARREPCHDRSGYTGAVVGHNHAAGHAEARPREAALRERYFIHRKTKKLSDWRTRGLSPVRTDALCGCA